ncbi:PREDICTED: putative U-box domain-containing protein 50 isoform X2 [Ipomoea nil]|uniref:putative U-box domain-containing protein 50 isoform X2 n=1 Tax=Ipomoea nil TaxID=35883 RepID=UPI0009019B49|nr:PREDICTED: putative U-box domain-containing protein 50 isoform X2 [Ipomoea nil]
MEESQKEERVYVGIGEDVHDGFQSLEWVLRNCSSQSTTILILYAANTICRDYVYTPIGRLPSSSVNEEKLKDLDKYEEAKTDKILANYIAFCGKVKAEILKIQRHDGSIEKIMVDLISSLQITKLVLSLTFMKPLLWKSRSALRGLFHIHNQKPDFCELFVVFGGKLVFLIEENGESVIKDEVGGVIGRAREKKKKKHGFKVLLERIMLPEIADKEKRSCDSPSSSSSSSVSNGLADQWEKNQSEIELYLSQLSSSKTDCDAANDPLEDCVKEPTMPENMTTKERIEALKAKIREVQQVVQLNKKEAKAIVERQAKAEWAIRLCASRAEDLEACINEEMAKRAHLEEELDSAKEELYELQTEVEEKRAKLNSILELQRELASKVQLSSQEKSHAEIQLERAVRTRTQMVQGIENLRRQRDVLRRRIEFCKEKDAIGEAKRLGEPSFCCRQFSAAEIRAATNEFSERQRLKCGGNWTNVYKGCLNSERVAIKLYHKSTSLSEETFQHQVKLLSSIRHPHIVSMIGFCSELKCIVFEYMRNGCLRDTLFSTNRNSKRRNEPLNWHASIHIAAEVCAGLSFLHQAKPRPMFHGKLSPSSILLDRNNVAKIHGLRPSPCYDVPSSRADVRGFGNLVVQLLTGRNWAGLVEEAALIGVLDQVGGEWPLDLAVELGNIARRCLSNQENLGKELTMAMVARDMNKVKKKADQSDVKVEEEDSEDVPSLFFCPIFQDIMKNPHIAADGFSYELEAIEEWLRTGCSMSPMTNLELKHKLLTPNHNLRSLIHEWENKRSALPS